MATSFGPETPILSYGPKAHCTDSGPRNEQEYVLWPAWAFHVIAPQFESLHFNEVQQAILGVLRASRLTATELGERLGLHPELAAFVVTEMQDLGWLDMEWTVTSDGRKLLEEELEMQASFVSGWVFKDPWQENLWPFVAPSLEYARVELDAKGNQVLNLGTTEQPWRKRPWRQTPSDPQVPGPPSTNDILRAALLQERRKDDQIYSEVQNHEDWDASGTLGLELKRIASIDADPEPVFLTSCLYVPRDGKDSELDWHACDFFGRGSDPILRRFVAREAAKNQNLARRLDGLLGHTFLYNDFNDFKRINEERKNRARTLVQQALIGRGVDQFSVAKPLAELFEGWLALHRLEKEGATDQRQGRSVLLACRGTLEHLFGDVAQEWPLADVTSSRHDQEINVAALRAAMAELGLKELPGALRRISTGQLKSTMKNPQTWRLRPMMAATLLRARAEENHPLRTAAKQSPDILTRIDHVANRGGGVIHYNEDVGFAAVTETVRETLEIVGLLLNLPIGDIERILQDDT